MQNSEKTLFRSASRFFSGTLLSRISGLGREMAMAFCFGAHPALAAFMVAFRFANLFRRLGEGSVATAFIPHFETLRSSSTKEGALFFRDLAYSLALFFSFFSILVMGILFVMMRWGGWTVEMKEILFLTLLMVPSIIFISLYGLSGALLQCHGRFFLSSFAPAFCNFTWILALFFLYNLDPHQAMPYLACAIVSAFLVQCSVTWPFASRYLSSHLDFREKLMPRLFSSDVRRLLVPILLSVVGVGAVQINSALDALFARAATPEGPAHLWYAIRLQQLPLALCGVALSAALLPQLSRSMQQGNLAEYVVLVQRGILRSFTLIFPITLAILVLGLSSVNLIYGRGHFTAHDTVETLLCLWGYSIGLLPSVLILLIVPAFYARKEFRVPMWGAVFAVGLNTLCNAYFVFFLGWGAFSIALATSVASWCNFWFLVSRLQRVVAVPLRQMIGPSLKTVLCAMIGAILALVGSYCVGDMTLPQLLGERGEEFPRAFTDQLFHFTLLALLFFVGTMGSAWLFKARELLALVRIDRSYGEP